MKKLFTIAIIVLLSNGGFAQGKIRYGVNGALTYSSYGGNSTIKSFDAGFDFMAGLTLEYKIKDKLALMAAINYDRKTASQELYTQIIENPDDPGFAGDMKITLRNQFITIPIVAKYDFGPRDSFFLNGGIFVSYMLKSELSNDYDNTTLDQTDQYKSLDYGLVFGLGKTFKLKGSKEITIEVRENLGLANISGGNRKINTNSLNLICGYSFDFK
ncbi:MAG TPA: porin family protein [Flavobacterium sp.]|uniref:porin family protein n=1 Tax=Flavobacterium sp. TaxID=239 RepID=UPI002BF4EB53|nr:porin family protein [Flavobacterium sp.]HNP33354.1 porin family protein [Flavobacterium sp.]